MSTVRAPGTFCTEVEPGKEYGLAALFQSWGLTGLSEGIASRWKCKVAHCTDTDAECLAAVLDGVPVMCNTAHAAHVFDKIPGNSGLDWICNGPWSSFKTPKIAFRGGWGQPGQTLVDECALELVNSFDDVLHKGTDPLNLQMFHRAEPDPATAVPVIPDLLSWPLPYFFDDGSKQFNRSDDMVDNEESCIAPACTVDRATRVSRGGAITWWHLDDCGEFTFQVGLPEPTPVPSTESDPTPVLIGPGGKRVVKIFIFAPKSAYELITQDDEVNKSGKFAGLQLFQTPDEFLPSSSMGENPQAGEAEDLPVFTVALLEAGGRPLLSPPNVPHLVITVDTCVMVEQRRVSRLFLDEVLYFQKRMARWIDPPIMYQFVTVSLPDHGFLDKDVAPFLTQALQNVTSEKQSALQNLGSGTEADRIQLSRVIATRAYQSFEALAQITPSYFDDANTTAQALVAAAGLVHRTGQTHDARSQRQHQVLLGMERGKTGLWWQQEKASARVAAYVHDNGCPRWGPLRATETAAIADRLVMLEACKHGTLSQALADLRCTASDQGGLSASHGHNGHTDAAAPTQHAVTAQVNAAHADADLFD
eukprot:m.326124 g.326124  ORF g.326124 m.326124 type:complete len:591 (+) comp20397_c0_seq1:240-2012(+)